MRIKYEILNAMYRMGAKSKLLSVTHKEITAGLANIDFHYAEKTVYIHLLELKKLGYVKNGMNQVHSKTYYITSEGIAWVKALEMEEEE